MFQPLNPTAIRTVHGYTLIERVARGPIEIWHARTDELKHTVPSWIEACRWAEGNRRIPASSKEWPPAGWYFGHKTAPRRSRYRS